ncbi:MAG: hypothetical protein HOP16_15820 [Acidobacteria bacterium]|nr:hypothetical protein [Acidobacteriota bacterium]
MRALLIVAGIVTVTLPLLGQASARAQAQAQVAAAAQGGGGRGGTLGPVNALGQEVKRPPVPTGPPPRLPDGTVDLNGLWNGGGPVNSIAQGLKQGETLPLLPLAKQLMDLRAQPKNETDDPHLWCMPMGVPRSVPYPFRFVQNYTHKAPTHMFILHEGNIHSYRQIFMDGRKHPAELDPTWFGHSIGSYDGKDTLVIDTVGFNDKFWFDRQGTPHTEQLHTIERWTRVNEGTLRNEVTIEDPGAYSRPFVTTWTARLAAPGDEIMENICQENNQFGAAGGHANPFNR